MSSTDFFIISSFLGGLVLLVFTLFAGEEIIRVKSQLSKIHNDLLSRKLGEWKLNPNGTQQFVITGDNR